jgi:3-oxoacyl-[acyl-carrier-protein] synthase III
LNAGVIVSVSLATLEHIESLLPERSVSIDELADGLGISQSKLKLFHRVHGLDRVRFDPEIGLFELVLPAARRVLAAMRDTGAIRYVIFAHVTQALTPAHMDAAQVIKAELGLHGAEAFALSQQNCASGMAAVDIAAELLRAEGAPGARALVVTGERAFSPHVQLIPNTTVMGEAAAACLVGIDGTGDTIDSYVTRTLGQYSAALLLDEERRVEFDHTYPPMLADVMRQAVGEAGLSTADIELVIPHNVNLFAWRQTIKKLDIPYDRYFLDNIPRFGHCYASDVFVNYTTLRDSGRLVAGRHYLLVSVGLGATFAAMTITHRGR